MFKSPTDYKHHHLFAEFYEALKADYAEWSGDIRSDLINVFKYEYPNAKHQYSESWYALPLYQKKQFNLDQWQRSVAVLRKMPGLFQSTVNFIEPHGGLPMHKDFGSWKRIEEAEGRAVEGWTIAIGLDMPSDRVRDVAIEFDLEDPMTYSNGEVVCFDGRNYEHKVWNNTDKWRVSAIIDLDAREFD